MGNRVRWRDGNAVRTGGLWIVRSLHTRGFCRDLSIEGFQLIEIDALNIATDASLRECERHPRFEPRDDAWFHLRVFIEVVVQTICPGADQGLQPLWTRGVFGLHVNGIDKEFHPQVAIDFSFAFGLCQTS